MKSRRFALAHLSDFHLCSPKGAGLQAFTNKRISGYLSWRLHRGRNHRDEILQALRQDLQHVNPDHIVITGDLTHLGLPGEFKKAQLLLNALGPPSRVTVIPGNHDTYVATASQPTFALWKEYMASDAESPYPETPPNYRTNFPSLRIRNGAALIGVSTARPSAPILAIGTIGHSQLRSLEKILDETGRQGLCRLVLTHHPPVSGVVSWRKRLTDAKAFRSVLQRCGAEMVLHGHAHRDTHRQIDTPAGKIPVIGVSSALSLGRNPQRRARYHVYHLGQTAQGWEIIFSVRAYSVKEKIFIAESRQRL
jgi:3',5'-cyclic AMP phosphodiesterase CpdA